MKIVIQRVKYARVEVESRCVGAIGKGALIFLGVARDDTPEDIQYLVRKVSHLRMFEDADGKMNLAAGDVAGEFLVVSQFTLLGNCGKGRRPSFDKAADPALGEVFYNRFVEHLRAQGFKVECGRFRAMMDVILLNDGPVTFILDSREAPGRVEEAGR
ncbi:MAG TPA: D-aminoacyl-tRNA deacylase [Candidatus Omnitrophota bacterium]|jgi:D-tyrosyl-tRNA(Tyr) deacylase|nr:D-aminoacyl-tRNA deacylase [Candidatus Omnitrophota bacterium]